MQTHTFRLAGDEPVAVRAIRPQDAGRLQAYMRLLSGASRRNRFLGAVSELGPAQLDRMTHMRGPCELALIAFAGTGAEATMVAEAIQVIAPESQHCEIALSVTDAWQRRGLGTLLLQSMECRARGLGARYLIGEVLRTNDAMKGLACKTGFAIRGPVTDARLIEIVKDLSVPQTGLQCDQPSVAVQPIAAGEGTPDRRMDAGRNGAASCACGLANYAIANPAYGLRAPAAQTRNCH